MNMNKKKLKIDKDDLSYEEPIDEVCLTGKYDAYFTQKQVTKFVISTICPILSTL